MTKKKYFFHRLNDGVGEGVEWGEEEAAKVGRLKMLDNRPITVKLHAQAIESVK